MHEENGRLRVKHLSLFQLVRHFSLLQLVRHFSFLGNARVMHPSSARRLWISLARTTAQVHAVVRRWNLQISTRPGACGCSRFTYKWQAGLFRCECYCVRGVDPVRTQVAGNHWSQVKLLKRERSQIGTSHKPLVLLSTVIGGSHLCL